MRQILQLLMITIALSGCFDPPLYRTPLPNGYLQTSNGGEFGMIILPFSPGENGGSVIAPKRDGQYVNKFGWAGDLVVGEITEYGPGEVFDPQIARGFFLLETVSGQVTYFDSLSEIKSAWQAASKMPFPALKRRHAARQKIRF